MRDRAAAGMVAGMEHARYDRALATEGFVLDTATFAIAAGVVLVIVLAIMAARRVLARAKDR